MRATAAPGSLTREKQAKQDRKSASGDAQQDRQRFSVEAANSKQGTRGMPGRPVPKKDVVHCEKRRSAVCRRDQPTMSEWGNPLSARTASPTSGWMRGTRGTETSQYPEEKRGFR